MSADEQFRLLLDVLLACGLAGLIGLERELSDKPAGFRTHMIIGGAAALFCILGEVLVIQLAHSDAAQYLRTDPIRIIDAVVVGISFIGAGTIIHKPAEASRVQFLTTAASILFSAAIGLAVARHLYILASGASVIVIFINVVFGYVERKFFRKFRQPNDDV